MEVCDYFFLLGVSLIICCIPIFSGNKSASLSTIENFFGTEIGYGGNEDDNESSNFENVMGSTPDETMGSTPDETMGSTPDETMGSTPDETMGSTPDETMGSTPDETMGSTS